MYFDLNTNTEDKINISEHFSCNYYAKLLIEHYSNALEMQITTHEYFMLEHLSLPTDIVQMFYKKLQNFNTF